MFAVSKNKRSQLLGRPSDQTIVVAESELVLANPDLELTLDDPGLEYTLSDSEEC